MAIYHCSVRTISRSDNHSAVAAAAYRSGQVLKDERTGRFHNYRNRKGILNALIFLPQTAPPELADRLTLWNAAESAEARKNSRVAREVILALPHELSESQRLALSKDMALFLVEKYGVAVDLAVHAPLEAHGDDPRNHHAHLLFTTREVTQEGLGAKTRILDDKEQGPVQIELIRQVWETLANDALQQAGLEGLRVDRRTLNDQGIDRIPQEHVGKAGTHADDEEEPRKKQDEGEDDEDGDTEQGKSGSGDSKAPATDKKPSSSKDPAKKDKPQTRASINEEIKRLNEQRAAFSPIPLKVQIKELDRLMDRLDCRVRRLKTLSDKTSLPERLTRAITSLYTRAKEFFAVRTKDEAARTFTAAEREAKAERQKARYGRTYQASLQDRMTEMRENIRILEAKQRQHQKYETFIQLIERRVETIRPTIRPPVLPAKIEWKATARPQTIQIKIVAEAKQVRENIPVEYRPNIKQEALTKSYKVALANSAAPVAITNSRKQVSTIVRGEETKQAEKHFTVAATPPEDKSDRSVWHKKVTIKIKSLDQMRSERMPISVKEPTDSRKIWKIETNDKGKVILQRIQADIRERKVAEPPRNKEGYSGRFNHPARTITDGESIHKVKIEAKVVRAKVPPDLRAETYFSNTKHSDKDDFSRAWEEVTQAGPVKPKSIIGSKFNQAARDIDFRETNLTASPDPKI